MQAQSEPQQDAALRSMIEHQAQAWNDGDATAWAASFTDNAAFINNRGDAVNGRPAIEQIHALIFSTFYKGSHTNVTVDCIRHIAPTVAMIDTVHELSDIASLPPGVATEGNVLRTRLRYIVVREADAWKIVAAQNTVISPKPLTPPKP